MVASSIKPPPPLAICKQRAAADQMRRAEQLLRLAAENEFTGKLQKQVLEDADCLFEMRLKYKG